MFMNISFTDPMTYVCIAMMVKMVLATMRLDADKLVQGYNPDGGFCK